MLSATAAVCSCASTAMIYCDLEPDLQALASDCDPTTVTQLRVSSSCFNRMQKPKLAPAWRQLEGTAVWSREQLEVWQMHREHGRCPPLPLALQAKVTDSVKPLNRPHSRRHFLYNCISSESLSALTGSFRDTLWSPQHLHAAYILTLNSERALHSAAWVPSVLTFHTADKTLLYQLTQ